MPEPCGVEPHLPIDHLHTCPTRAALSFRLSVNRYRRRLLLSPTTKFDGETGTTFWKRMVISFVRDTVQTGFPRGTLMARIRETARILKLCRCVTEVLCDKFHADMSSQYRPNLLDATRISDGLRVYIKRVLRGGQELAIATYFSQVSQRDHPMNHVVPILDTFEDDSEPTISYMVMPFLRLMDDPPFSHVNDVVDFVSQTMEVSWTVCLHTLGILLMQSTGPRVHALARSSPSVRVRSVSIPCHSLFPSVMALERIS